MKTSIQLTVAALVLGAVSTLAQSSGLNGAKLSIASIDLTGASSLHRLNLAVDTNNVISATGTRYDTAAGAVSFDPADGASVASLAGSGFGASVATTNTTSADKTLRNPRTRTNVAVTVTNIAVTTISPFGIFLDDNSQIKGAVTSISCTTQDVRLSWSGTPIFTPRTGESRSKVDGAIAYGEKTGNFFSSGSDSDRR